LFFYFYISPTLRIVQTTTLYSGQSFGVADAAGDIVQHDIWEMESAAEYAGFILKAMA
jgi:hypothetical protein